MRQRSLIVLALGVVIALMVAMSLKSRMGGEDTGDVQILAASMDIPLGSFVRTGQNLIFVDWPEDKITEAMLTSNNVKLDDFQGAVVRRPLQKGEPALKNDLVQASEGGFMSAVLEPGKRAISIAVDPTSGNAGFIFPGDKVDLILSLSINQRGQQARASETFIEDVRVLAIDQMMGNPENKAVLAKTVTLEVTPKQAEEINVAKDLGKISLSLRSLAKQEVQGTVEGTGTPEDEPQSFDDVLRNMPTAAPEDEGGVTRDTDVSRIMTPQGVAGSVRVIRGSDQQVIDFNGEASKRAP